MSARAGFGDRSKIEGGRLRANATRAVRVVSALGLLLLFGCGGDDGIGVDDAGGIVGTPDPSNPLMNPAAFDEPAPEVFRARFETSRGDFVIEVHRNWAPIGADRFFNLVKNGYYDDVRFFRVLDGFVAQFGMHGDPLVNQAWENHPIPDDPVTRSNLRGFVTFAKSSAPDSRDDTGLHKLRRQLPPGRRGIRPLRAGRGGNGRRRSAFFGLRRHSGSAEHRDSGQRLPDGGLPQPRLRATSQHRLARHGGP